jgi:hypothetical protein
MMFKRNLPGWERIARATAGIGLLVAPAVLPLGAGLGWVAGLSGAMLLVSSLLGFCPACALAGRRLP